MICPSCGASFGPGVRGHDAQPGGLLTDSQLKKLDMIAVAWFLAGPLPTEPVFFAKRGLPATHVDPATGFIVYDRDPGTTRPHWTSCLLGDPNADAEAQAFGAAVAAWNNRFKLLLAVLENH